MLHRIKTTILSLKLSQYSKHLLEHLSSSGKRYTLQGMALGCGQDMCCFWVWWVFWCLTRCAVWRKLFPQTVHVYGFSPVWTSWWRMRWDKQLKFWPQTGHLCGFFPLWIRLWLLRLTFASLLFSHFEHLYGFSPEWILWSFPRSEIWLKLFPQSEHRSGFSLVWILWCLSRPDFRVKLFPQTEHIFLLIPLGALCGTRISNRSLSGPRMDLFHWYSSAPLSPLFSPSWFPKLSTTSHVSVSSKVTSSAPSSLITHPWLLPARAKQ